MTDNTNVRLTNDELKAIRDFYADRIVKTIVRIKSQVAREHTADIPRLLEEQRNYEQSLNKFEKVMAKRRL